MEARLHVAQLVAIIARSRVVNAAMSTQATVAKIREIVKKVL